MAVRKEKSIPVNVAPEDAFIAATAALQAMGAEIVQTNPAMGVIYAKIGFTWKSFGENITVQVGDAPPQVVVFIASESAITTTIFDYGKNNQNLQQFEQALYAQLSAPPVAPPAQGESNLDDWLPQMPTEPESSDAPRSPLIFVSYRREDSADVAGRIYDRLIGSFGREAVFKDVDNIPLGVNYKTHLENVVNQCSHLLAIIGRQWTTIVDEQGKRRLEKPTDFVRIEIEAALKRDIPVIPLLVQGAKMPDLDKLPDTMRDLYYRNGTPIRADPDFHSDMDRLIKALRG